MKKPIVFIILFSTFIIYSLIVYTCGTDLSLYSANDKAIKGKLLFQKYNCNSCHQIYGLGGYLGADLTNVISAKNKGEQYAKVFIKNGTQRMPDLKLNDRDIDYLIEYLRYVDQTAITYRQNSKNDI